LTKAAFSFDDPAVSTPTDVRHRDELAALWERFAELETGAYSPIYAAIGRSVAGDDELLDLVRAAPPRAHLPIMLMAAAHYVLRSGVDHPLRDVYAGRADARDAPAQFRDLCLTHRDDVLRVMSERRIQTNECGRSALIALGLAAVEDRIGPLEVLVDAGASAGLNLLYDRYHLAYGDLGSRGDPASPVRIDCTVTGRGSLPSSLPDVPVRVGVDRDPVDVTDADHHEWLLACTWPDTGRLERTAAALALAATDPPEIRPGDMAVDIPTVLDELGGDGPAVVVTSWALAYLGRRDRARFLEGLDAAAERRPVVWLSFEGPGAVDLAEQPRVPDGVEITPSILAMARFGGTGGAARALALVHPHGSWIHWLA
jgi:hypothetical protein